MEIGQRIKGHRARLGLSQDELAQRIYVSRQTISSWENDKTYPDVQSLLLLSTTFDATVDSLIKGDVEAMERTLNDDAKRLNRLGGVMAGSLALMVLATLWWGAQLYWDWELAQMLSTGALILVLWGIAMAASVGAERIKRENDLMTYQEVLAFSKGEPVERDTEKGRRARALSRGMTLARTIGLTLASLAVGAVAGYWTFKLIVASGLLG